MTKITGTLNKWRDYFETANSDIFNVIEYAVMVAAVDYPKEFKLRRDRIAELLFTCKVIRCFGCDKVELALPNAANDDDKVFVSEFGGCDVKESKSSRGDDQIGMNVNQKISNYSYDEAEALTDEIEQESKIVEEVLRIKEIIDNFHDESDSDIYECLRRLQLMALSVETLKATEIGKSVNALRKHSSNNIRHLARTLVEDWKVVVEAWVNATTAFTENTPESMKASVVDEEEEGLPSPPLDDLAFISTQTTSMEFSQFFDGMDDDGNIRNSGEFNQSHENGRKDNPVQKQQFAESVTAAPKDMKVEKPKKQTSVVKPNKPFGGDSGPGRPIQPTFERKLNNDEMKLLQKSDKGIIRQRHVPTQQNRLKCPDEDADRVKLEATKRKLQERYQEAEKAKKQRTIQVMELNDIPKQGFRKQGPGHKNSHVRPGNHNRHWPNGHR
ncbi:PREDICTED: probable mediator of RNA polymerase II transcription subunit 26b [Nicotiana attenuata]|uniref:Mediator of rna polymerase ii transcription subunit 26b n=1 Tax=Nicotiana attenuata TaxID=49451 RepID=A0A1J6IJ39_NICAT|nr:PREDICTED: probable mediator of RNA polymerase II transcription subunit 26b [Nicotiana attenuata]OIS97750.1 putative mediator of rna polymerase ii transcription subunit 26b [Nicotiana attenuata]